MDNSCTMGICASSRLVEYKSTGGGKKGVGWGSKAQVSWRFAWHGGCDNATLSRAWVGAPRHAATCTPLRLSHAVLVAHTVEECAFNRSFD